jgi:hypothetical protein
MKDMESACTLKLGEAAGAKMLIRPTDYRDLRMSFMEDNFEMDLKNA